MRLFVQLIFVRSEKILAFFFVWILAVRCGSGAATLQEDPPLFRSWGDELILPSDVYFKKDLASPGGRLPDEDSSIGRVMAESARRDPVAYDGYSPRSQIFISLPCNLREETIPDHGPVDPLLILDVSRGRSIPFHVRYRNRSNCGLVVQPAIPLDMDGIYAVFVLNSQIWQGRLKPSTEFGAVLEDSSRMREITPELEKRANRFGLRPREVRLALDLLRQRGHSLSNVLRLGIFAVRSRGGLYGPFLAMRARYLLSAPPVLTHADGRPAGDGRIVTLRLKMRDPCGTDPCRLAPVSGPGILASPRTAEDRTREIVLLLRFPEEPVEGVLWIEAPEPSMEMNQHFFSLSLIGRLAREANVVVAMLPDVPRREPADRMAELLRKMAVSHYLASRTTLLQLRHCAEEKECPSSLRAEGSNSGLTQLCLREGDCTASAFLDPHVERAIFPFALRALLSRPRYENGALPLREAIEKGYAEDLREDLFSSDLYSKWNAASSFGLMRKETHITKNIFSPNQFEELVEFVKRSKKKNTNPEKLQGAHQ